jgi:RNA polymerase sigma factor (sigma-70 family)
VVRAGDVETRLQARPCAGARGLDGLYELYGPALRRRCVSLTRNPAAADDLMQEVWVRFIARFPEPPVEMNVGAYLNAMAQNILWKQLRDSHEVVDGEIETSIGADDDLERDPERSTLLVEQRHLVRRCAALLTGRQRTALTLREVEGRSYAEIASELDIGVDAVAQVISRGRVRLRLSLRRAQIDLDQLAPECRELLGPLSDYVDSRQLTTAPEVQAHLAACEDCQRTVAAYQEAGSRLRGLAPLAPFAAMVARAGELVRGGADAPLGLGAVASLATAAVIAVGGGGMLVAEHVTSSPRSQGTTRAAVSGPSAHAVVATPPRSTPSTTVAPVAGAEAVLPRHWRRASAAPGAPAKAHTVRRRPHAPSTATAAPATTPRSEPAAAPPATTTVAVPVVQPATTIPTRTPPTSTAPTTPVTTPVTTTPTTPVTTPVSTTPGGETGALPHVTVPQVTVPSVSVPSVNVPGVTTPAVSVPSVTVPAISTPAITTPIGTVPSLSTPAVSTPAVDVPPITTPAISTPIIKLPSITTPKLP